MIVYCADHNFVSRSTGISFCFFSGLFIWVYGATVAFLVVVAIHFTASFALAEAKRLNRRDGRFSKATETLLQWQATLIWQGRDRLDLTAVLM